MTCIISADEIKKILPGYEPAYSEQFHEQSARLADKEYAKALKERPEKRVILLAGGSASGKSEYVSAYLGSSEAIIMDGTLPSSQGAKIKIEAALKANKTVEVHAIMPEDLTIAFVAFLGRERKFSVEHFFRTHSLSRRTLLYVAEVYPMVQINLIDSRYDATLQDANMHFTA